jgi:hypothetical protein
MITERVMDLMRDRLVELIRNSHCVDTWNYYTDDFKEPNPIEELADILLANGVIVLPCKVGDHVYQIHDGEVTKHKVMGISISNGDLFLHCSEINCGVWASEIGTKVFMSADEAERMINDVTSYELFTQ